MRRRFATGAFFPDVYSETLSLLGYFRGSPTVDFRVHH
jgi:hypothetical protein